MWSHLLKKSLWKTSFFVQWRERRIWAELLRLPCLRGFQLAQASISLSKGYSKEVNQSVSVKLFLVFKVKAYFVDIVLPKIQVSQVIPHSKFGSIIPLSANFAKWSNTLKQFVGKLPTNWLSVFEHFAGLALKRL